MPLERWDSFLFCLRGFPLAALVFTTAYLASEVNIPSVPSTKCPDEDLDVAPGQCTAAARCSSLEDGQSAESKLRATSLCVSVQ